MLREPAANVSPGSRCDELAGREDIHGRAVQSFWGKQAKEAYQDDHLFIAKAWAPRIRSCNVTDNDIVRRVSDHGPVVLDLDVSAR